MLDAGALGALGYGIAVRSGDVVGAALWLIALIALRIVRGHEGQRTTRQAIFAVLVASSGTLLVLGRYEILHVILPATVAALPVAFRRRSCSNRLLKVGTWIACLAAASWGFSGIRSDHRAAVVTHGKWAQVNASYSLEGLNIASAYSYSELPRLLNSSVREFSNDLTGYDEMWVITPTTPIDADNQVKIEQWVKKGGHLIVVTDHTDLYGHARVSNTLLKPFGIEANYDTSISEHGLEYADRPIGREIRIKSANSFRANGAFPLITKLGLFEKAYYGRDNFFGPLTPSLDDSRDRRPLAVSKRIGRGQVTGFGDSTMLANFALYQPDSIATLQLVRKRYYLAAVIMWLPWLLLLTVLATSGNGQGPVPIALMLVVMLSVIDLRSDPLDWTIPHIYWAGDHEAIMEGGAPTAKFSTAYSITALGGAAPRWITSGYEGKNGIWVSSNREAPAGWRWLRPEVDEQCEVFSWDPAWAKLFEALQAQSPRDWRPLFMHRANARAAQVWTDDVMGNWWFDRGISDARRARFESFLAWCKGDPAPQVPSDDRELWDSSKTIRWEIRLPGNPDPSVLYGPVMLPRSATRKEILLGRGITLEPVPQQQGTVFLGQRSKCEAIFAPEVFVLIPNYVDANKQ